MITYAGNLASSINDLTTTLLTVLSILLGFMTFVCASIYAVSWPQKVRKALKFVVCVLCLSMATVGFLFLVSVSHSYMAHIEVINIQVSYFLSGVVLLMATGGVVLTIIVCKN